MTRFRISIARASVVLVFIGNTSLMRASDASDGATMTVDDAIAIALETQPGTIGEAELDVFEGKSAYDIEVINQAGKEIEFKIDAETGEILNVWTDDDPGDDPVSSGPDDTTD